MSLFNLWGETTYDSPVSLRVGLPCSCKTWFNVSKFVFRTLGYIPVLYTGMNLDWASGRKLCPSPESFVIQPIFIELLLCTQHHVNTTSREQPGLQWAPRRKGRKVVPQSPVAWAQWNKYEDTQEGGVSLSGGPSWTRLWNLNLSLWSVGTCPQQTHLHWCPDLVYMRIRMIKTVTWWTRMNASADQWKHSLCLSCVWR